jgi:hypothetical protein
MNAEKGAAELQIQGLDYFLMLQITEYSKLQIIHV